MLLTPVRRLIDAGDRSRIPNVELLDSVLPDTGDTAQKATAFWALLVASSIVSAVGVLTDSTATVIGAMVIAPLGTPIYGVAAALVAGVPVGPVARRLVIGITLAVAIGAAFELILLDFQPIEANDQVSARTSPSLPDLVVALATGFAGSLALVRRDISPALPGVAIAISLVPPLSVVGICLAGEAWASAFGALVLFGTNLLAIVAAGLVVFGAANLRAQDGKHVRSRRTAITLGIASVIVLASLVVGSARAALLYRDQQRVHAAAQKWADAHPSWDLEAVVRTGDRIDVTYVGEGGRDEPASVTEDDLITSIRDSDVAVEVRFVEGASRRIG